MHVLHPRPPRENLIELPANADALATILVVPAPRAAAMASHRLLLDIEVGVWIAAKGVPMLACLGSGDGQIKVVGPRFTGPVRVSAAYLQ